MDGRRRVSFADTKPNNKKRWPVPQARFFALLNGRLEDALLIYSNMIDEPIEVDSALETLTEPGITFIPFLPQPTYEKGLAEIEEVATRRAELLPCVMTYLTVEVEIDHGHVSARGIEILPEKTSCLFTILNPPQLTQPLVSVGQR